MFMPTQRITKKNWPRKHFTADLSITGLTSFNCIGSHVIIRKTKPSRRHYSSSCTYVSSVKKPKSEKEVNIMKHK